MEPSKHKVRGDTIFTNAVRGSGFFDRLCIQSLQARTSACSPDLDEACDPDIAKTASKATLPTFIVRARFW
ncbi:MAG TPA: hypothetical protein VF548_08270 [Allosphingosinicella sp.]|jgi:hypothetical protein